MIMISDNNGKYLTTKEVANVFHLHVSTICKWESNGFFVQRKLVMLNGKLRGRFLKSDVEEFLNNKREPEEILEGWNE